MRLYLIKVRDANDHETEWANVGVFDEEHYREVLDEIKENVAKNYSNDLEVIFVPYELNKRHEFINENGKKIIYGSLTIPNYESMYK